MVVRLKTVEMLVQTICKLLHISGCPSAFHTLDGIVNTTLAVAYFSAIFQRNLSYHSDTMPSCSCSCPRPSCFFVPVLVLVVVVVVVDGDGDDAASRPQESRLIMYGGWANKWLDDCWQISVSSIVGTLADGRPWEMGGCDISS